MHSIARPSVFHQNHSGGSETLTIVQPRSEPNHRAQSWRGVAYLAVLVPVLFLGALAWMRRDFRNPEIPDWKPVLALANTAQEKGDLYYAKSLYSQAGRLAALREDWAGLAAAACAMNKLDKQKSRYAPANALLLRAMIAAETKQSRSGMAAVAKAFMGLGEDKVAAMVVSRIQKDWPENATDAANVLSPGCWAN
jgi:hypothetical protein